MLEDIKIELVSAIKEQYLLVVEIATVDETYEEENAKIQKSYKKGLLAIADEKVEHLLTAYKQCKEMIGKGE